MMHRFLYASLVPLLFASFAGAAEVPSFRNQIIPILTKTGCNSGACHGALAGKGGLKLSLRGFDPESDHHVLTRQALARRVDLTNAADSLLLKKVTRTMPHGGGRRIEEGSANYTLLLDWVRGGAMGPREGEPDLKSLELLPKSAMAKPKDTLRVTVKGTYSDGTIRDVTAWTKFGSSEEPVATVDDDGQVTVVTSGEAAITANFGSRVATMTFTVPYTNAVADDVYTKSPRRNFIDEHVLRKLQLLKIAPSGTCTDTEFLRRAYLDSCGILPKPEELQAFLVDARIDKREKVIDALLARPEFTDYWAHKWSDLLLVSSKRLPQPAVWAFYRKVRQSVSENQPWDQFAREILTASGSTITNGAAGYFVIHKDVSDLVESTTVTFLGTSINCCRCHNHPLEKWTQDQYWSMANLFGRVGLKNGERAGEVYVQSLPTGDALHLRRGIAMPPTPLDGKPMAADVATDRREALADWMTAKENPYFAKAVINRIWRNYMGRGLVEAEDDLRETNPPTNRELFDALANDFIGHKYDVKHLMRTILNSAAYQRSAQPLPTNASDDRFYSRYLLRRLSAEVILDAYSDVANVPTPFNVLSLGASGGTQNSTNYPTGTRAMQLPDSQLVSQFLDAFGRAERGQTCSCERTSDSSVSQALHLNNGQTLNDKLRDKTSRVSIWLGDKSTDEEIVGRLYRLALSREPNAAEKAKLLPILAAANKEGPAARREAVEDLFWAVLTSQEFLFNR